MAKKITLTESKFKHYIEEQVRHILAENIAASIKGDKLHSSLYECINRANSWSEGMKLNNFPIIEYREERKILGEDIQFEPEQNERGGIIVFSADVNAIQFSPNKIADWIKQKIAMSHDLVGWTIGHYLDGRYTAKNGKQYGEKSLSVEIVGVNFEKLVRIGEDLCRSFQQDPVLVKDYSSRRVLFVDPL